MKLVNFTNEINKILQVYSYEIDNAICNITKETAKEMQKRLKEVSPKRMGGYRAGWKVTYKRGVRKGDAMVVYNKDHYRLTHLLEHGHKVVNNGKVLGHTDKHIHIAPVEEWGIEHFRKKVTEAINEAGRNI